MQPVKLVTGRMAPLDLADVDTDQIIPKQFLKRIERTGYGPFLFYDWRARGDFVLDRPEYAGAQVLVAGANFGCGSSREHAPWALRDYGFRAVVSSSIADIFRTNALKNGLVPVVVDAAVHDRLLATPGIEVTIDLDTRTLGAVGGPKWDAHAPVRPEQGLLALRKELGLYANLRPVGLHPRLIDASPLKAELLRDVDLVVVRELTGGLYFGEKRREGDIASDLCVYSGEEVRRVVRVAGRLARQRPRRV